jgi:hypothetical protein
VPTPAVKTLAALIEKRIVNPPDGTNDVPIRQATI